MATPDRLRHHVAVFGSVPAYMREAMAAAYPRSNLRADGRRNLRALRGAFRFVLHPQAERDSPTQSVVGRMQPGAESLVPFHGDCDVIRTLGASGSVALDRLSRRRPGDRTAICAT